LAELSVRRAMTSSRLPGRRVSFAIRPYMGAILVRGCGDLG
jgi:hypothetical protein